MPLLHLIVDIESFSVSIRSRIRFLFRLFLHFPSRFRGGIWSHALLNHHLHRSCVFQHVLCPHFPDLVSLILLCPGVLLSCFPIFGPFPRYIHVFDTCMVCRIQRSCSFLHEVSFEKCKNSRKRNRMDTEKVS